MIVRTPVFAEVYSAIIAAIFQVDDNQVWEVGISQTLPVFSRSVDNMTEVVSTHPCVAKAFQMGIKSGEN